MARGKAEMEQRKQRLIQQRDQLLKEIEALRNRVLGLEMALAVFDDEDGPSPLPTPRKRRSGIKEIVLSLLQDAATAGLNGAMAVETAARRGQHIDRQTVSSLLSRMKAEGGLVYEDGRYKLKQFAGQEVDNHLRAVG